MRVMIAGGVFRLPQEDLEARQPSPEIVLSDGLRRRGIGVTTVPLERLSSVYFARGHDLLHVHHLSKAAVAAALSPRRVPFVFTPHRMNSPASVVDALGSRAVMARMDAGICLSEVERLVWARKCPTVAGRLHLIPNGVPAFDHASKLRTWDCDRQPLKILYVGQLIELKRIDRIFLAMRQLPCSKLRLVYHNAWLERTLRAKVYELGIEDRVVFVGQRSGSELALEYSAAHVLALPSIEEALPSVVTEALQSGLPVVASDVGGINAQVGSAGILTDPFDDDSLRRGLNELIGRYPQIAQNAIDRSISISSDFDENTMVEKHIRLYDSLLRR